MIARYLVPTLLFLALLLGGSAQGPGNILILELAAIALLGWTYAKPGAAAGRPARQLRVLGWAAVLLVALQLVPLPPLLWHALPGREFVAMGDALLGVGDAWRPLSLEPEATLGALLMLAVPLAIIAAGTRGLDTPRTAIAGSVVVATTIAVLWGLAQQAGGAPHLYAFSSSGPTGPFANTNHLATLAVASMPFAGALVAELGRRRKSIAWRTMGGLFAILLALTIILTGSMAMIVLMVPVLGLSSVIATRGIPRRSVVAIGGATLAALALVAVLGAAFSTGDATVSAASRADIWRHSLSLSPLMATGGGYGVFPALYALVEDPFRVDSFFVNHAHNEIIELAIEGGIAALALVALFVIWWGRAAWAVWRPGIEADPFARAGAVGASVLFLHSLVDFPMRTEAHLALMAACLVLLALGKPPKPVFDKRDLRPTRHRRVDGSTPADNRR